MKVMTCNGFSARITFDRRDNILVGRVLGVNEIISFHGNDIGQLQLAFQQAVADFSSEASGDAQHVVVPAKAGTQ